MPLFAHVAENLQQDKNPVAATRAPLDTLLDFVPPYPALWKSLSTSSWHSWSHIQGDKSAKLPLEARLQVVSQWPR